MFDRCRSWRRQLTRWADGTLSSAEWGALEKHLARCHHCRIAATADQALRDTLRTHTGLLDARAARTLDDGVVLRLLRVKRASVNTGLIAPRPMGNPPIVYLFQAVGSAFATAAVTALFLAPALHPGTGVAHDERYPATVERSEPPVPLGSLLQNASPRAALLWTQPTPHQSVPGAPGPIHVRPISVTPLRHTASPAAQIPFLQNPTNPERLKADHRLVNPRDVLGS